MRTIFGQNEFHDVTPAEARRLQEAGLVEQHHEYPGALTPVPYGDDEPWDDIARVAGWNRS